MSERVWTVKDALAWTVEYFERREVDAPRRSAEWLLSAATGLSRLELYAHHDRSLTDAERTEFRAGIARRAEGEPLQYVTGEMPFRHLVVRCRPGVFIPRPETEVLVDAALEALGDAPAEGAVIVDLCTGSGAVAVSIAHERPGARVWAVDRSAEACECAADNAERAGVGERVTVLCGDLFGPLPEELRGRVDVVAANPPYIPTADLTSLPAEVARFDPPEALDGGPDGLAVVRRIVEEAKTWLRPGGLLVIETDTDKAKDAAVLVAAWYEGSGVRPDLTGRDRIALGTRREA